ncbi:hypothetical protein CU661_02295, partial [Pseudomonas syringae pv. actinidifoliorum]|nr:hypothetical protein [Pseudomonas syringae pv. actinidifoliorum]
MRTSLCKAHPPCNTPKTTDPAQRLFMRQIAI